MRKNDPELPGSQLSELHMDSLHNNSMIGYQFCICTALLIPEMAI